MLAQKAPIHLHGCAEQPREATGSVHGDPTCRLVNFSRTPYAACPPCCIDHTLGALLPLVHEILGPACPITSCFPHARQQWCPAAAASYNSLGALLQLVLAKEHHIPPVACTEGFEESTAPVWLCTIGLAPPWRCTLRRTAPSRPCTPLSLGATAQRATPTSMHSTKYLQPESLRHGQSPALTQEEVQAKQAQRQGQLAGVLAAAPHQPEGHGLQHLQRDPHLHGSWRSSQGSESAIRRNSRRQGGGLQGSAEGTHTCGSGSEHGVYEAWRKAGGAARRQHFSSVHPSAYRHRRAAEWWQVGAMAGSSASSAQKQRVHRSCLPAGTHSWAASSWA